MDVACIPFAKTGYFSQLIVDYLDQNEVLAPFYGAFPDETSFREQLAAKQQSFPADHRAALHAALQQQYSSLETSESTASHLAMLKAPNTFTVVTGHQLNLFTGPLYFLYKIISAIKLSSALKAAYPDFNFVPVYWMATEDHDFEEINYFNLKGKKIRWNKAASGAVGRLDTQGLQAVYDTFAQELGGGEHAASLKALFARAYLEHDRLGEATRFLANELFKEYGLVILDGDDASLKRLLLPYMKKDLFEGLSFQHVSETIAALQEVDPGYTIQVNPREINYFYLKDGLRERLESRNGHFYVLNTDKVFTTSELEREMETHPERFSPNVIARPLYQEVILPNLCYIGGGGELAYWLELKGMFRAMGVPFPILMLRNSALLIPEKQGKKLAKLNVQVQDLFLKQSSLINKKVREISNIDIDFTPQRTHLKEQFAALYKLAKQTDPSFYGAVKAQEVKQLKGLDTLEKRLLKAQKRKLQDQVQRLAALQNNLFPGQNLQERQLNFSELYLELGEELIPALMENLQVYPSGFMVLRY